MVTFVDESMITPFRPTIGRKLILNVERGRVRFSNTLKSFPDSTIELQDNTTNYVFIETGGIATQTSGFPNNSFFVAIVTTSAGKITDIEDSRAVFYVR